MPSASKARVLKDPELKHFAHTLQNTTLGKQYMTAWRDVNSCEKQIRMALKHGYLDQVEEWRKSLAIASSNATRILTLLEQKHHWPEFSPIPRPEFHYHPKPRSASK